MTPARSLDFLTPVLLCGTLVALAFNRRRFDRMVFALLLASVASLLVAEVFSVVSFGREVFGDILQHGFRLMSLFLLYRVFVAGSLVRALVPLGQGPSDKHVEPSRLLSFPELNPNPVVETDLAGNVTYLNSAAEKLFPSLKQMGSRHPFLSDWPAIAACSQSRAQDPMSRSVWVADLSYSQSIHYLPDHKTVRIYAVEDTVTRRAEAILQASNVDLQAQVNERTSELSDAVHQLEDEVILRTHTQEVLALRSRMLEAYFSHAAAPMVFLSPTFDFLRVNEAYARVCGKESQDFLGRNYFDLHPDTKHKEIFAEVLRTKTPYQASADKMILPCGAEGGVTYWDWALTPLLDTDGAVESLAFAMQDATSRIHAQDALRQQAELLDVSGDAIIARDMQDRVVFWSLGAQRTYGWTAEEALGKSLKALFQTRFPVAEGAVRDDFRRAGQWQGELTHRTKQDRWIVVASRWSFQLDSLGVPFRVLEVNRDITDAKLAQDQLEALYIQLTERTEQLGGLASELAKAEQRERRRMASLLHDHLQQILVSAKYMTGPLETHEDQPVRSAARRVQELLDQSIGCSRSLTAELSPPILFRDGIAVMLDWLAITMESKHGLHVELQADKGPVTESEELTILLYQSVRELLFNAVKHAKVKTARVAFVRPDGRVQVTISDEGRGFDPASLGSTDHPREGYGIFSIQSRMQLLGGGMTVESSPGRGSRFTLWAPLRAAAPAPAETGEPAPTASPEPTQLTPVKARRDRGKVRVLLVDDHPLVRQGLVRLLREVPDIEIVGEVADGRTAVEMARRLEPDVVTMDINMPDMDGIEATRLIHEACPNVKVIGLSMYDEPGRATEMLNAGATLYLTKGSPYHTLISSILRCVGPRKKRQARH